MRLLATTLLAASLAFSQAQPATTRVSGRVLSTAGNPIPEATASLTSVQSQVNLTVGRPKSITAKTGANGAFVIDDVPPGQYYYGATHEGFVVTGQRPTLTVVAGQRLDDLEILLEPTATVSGRVLDENGDPLPNIHVSSWQAGYNGVRHIVTGPFAHVNTGPDGVYRFENVSPGRYNFIAADDATRAAISKGELSPTTGETSTYVTTLYPAALTPDTATVVNVASAADVQGIDIQLRRELIYTIRGQALGPDGEPAAGVTLGLHPRQRTVPASGARVLSTTAEDGSFSFPRLPAGAYLISTMPAPGPDGRPGLSPVDGRLEVVLTKGDAEDIVFRLLPRPEVTGTVLTDEGKPLQTDPRPMLALDDADGAPITGGALLEPDGSFTAQGVGPTKYRVSFLNAIPGHYIQSVRFNNRDITHDLLDLTSGAGGRLDVVVSAKVATTAGQVRDSQGDPVTGARVTLIDPQGRIRYTRTDQYGAYRFTDLAPGEYRLAAWESEANGLLTNPNFRALFASQTEIAKLSESEQSSTELKLIPQASIGAAATRF